MAAKRHGSEGGRAAGDSDEFPTPNLSIFEFTPDDLKANQRGYLTDRQRGYLQSTARGIRGCSMTSAAAALGFVALGVGIMLALFMQNEDSRALFSDPRNQLMLAGAGLVAVAAIILTIYLARRQASAVTAAGLQAVQGPVRLDQDFSVRSNITSYHVFVGDHKFSFTEDMSRIFHEGANYRVYFCKSGPYQLIMSYKEFG